MRAQVAGDPVRKTRSRSRNWYKKLVKSGPDFANSAERNLFIQKTNHLDPMEGAALHIPAASMQ